MVRNDLPTKLYAKAALFGPDGKVLVLRRSNTDPSRPLGYDFPGGGVDEGENHEDAVIREIEEEVGIALTRDDIELAWAKAHVHEGINGIAFFYIGWVKSVPEILLSYEHDKYWWMTVDEAVETVKHPAWHKALRYARDYLLAE